jgi:hypothetical protein
MALRTLEFAPTWTRGSRSCLLLSLLPLVSACDDVPLAVIYFDIAAVGLNASKGPDRGLISDGSFPPHRAQIVTSISSDCKDRNAACKKLQR